MLKIYIHIIAEEGADDGCTGNPCVNGTCYDLYHGYGCLCNDGYSGKNCDTCKSI